MFVWISFLKLRILMNIDMDTTAYAVDEVYIVSAIISNKSSSSGRFAYRFASFAVCCLSSPLVQMSIDWNLIAFHFDMYVFESTNQRNLTEV